MRKLRAMPPPIRRPPALHALLESRAPYEFGAFVAGSPLLRMIGRGDRHPVLVIPGFVSTDATTRPLRWALRSQGYWVHGWHLGRNIPSEAVFTGLPARLSELHERHGAKVSIIGMSLGGIYARELARAQPGAVRQVITLGSPFRLRPGDKSTLSGVWERFGAHWPDWPCRSRSRASTAAPMDWSAGTPRSRRRASSERTSR
jgi:pimeloyl-ACP methyl ester carboxylesterase